MDGIILDHANTQKSFRRFYWRINSRNVFGEGLIIHHNGNIVVNRSSKVEKNCQMHGDNCIGNVGKLDSLTDCLQIGNNVEIGVGQRCWEESLLQTI